MSTSPEILHASDELIVENRQAQEEELDHEGKRHVATVPDTYPDSPIHYNLRTLSYSGVLTKHSCPRKFELSRMLPRSDDSDEAGHLIFGTVVGNGIQEYLITGDLQKAIFRAFLDWDDNLESDRGLKSAKTFWHAVYAIQQFVRVRNTQLSAYDIAIFNGKPAVELGFAILLPDGFKYRGKLDALMIHRQKREYLVIECKTTGFSKVDEAMYKNSNQAIGYGIVIDAVAHQDTTIDQEGNRVVSNSYDVMYPVYMTKSMEWEPFRFGKSNVQRALWLQSLLYEVDNIIQYHDAGYFPTFGESCVSFGRQCPFFGTCTLSNKYLISDPSKIKIKLDTVDEYPLTFSVEELVQAQINKD